MTVVVKDLNFSQLYDEANNDLKLILSYAKNQPLMTIRQYWLGKTKPKQAFRSTQNAFYGI